MYKLTLKTPAQIAILAQGGQKLAHVRAELVAAVKPGLTTAWLDALAERLITQAGGQPSFKKVAGYSWATCLSVNDEVVHGVPSQRVLVAGDVVGIDVGLYYRGWHTDTSVTVKVGGASAQVDKFLACGRQALAAAIGQAQPGGQIADISTAMQRVVEENGYSVVRALTGHGIGRQLHEEPAIPCFVTDPQAPSPPLVPGLVLAIEVMYNQGGPGVVYKNADGWTIATADGKISGLFEETVAVTPAGPLVLTRQT